MADLSTRRLRTACYNCCNKSIPDLAAFRLEYPPNRLPAVRASRKNVRAAALLLKVRFLDLLLYRKKEEKQGGSLEIRALI
jgi:hypothetical protein